MLNICDNVPFSFLLDVSLYLAEVLAIKSSLWNHWTSNPTLLSTCSSNHAGFPSRNESLLLSKWSIIGTSKKEIGKRILGFEDIYVPYRL